MNPVKHNHLLFCLFSTVSVIPIKGIVTILPCPACGAIHGLPTVILISLCCFFEWGTWWLWDFWSAFAPASSKAVFSCVFFPQKEIQSLYNLSMFALLEMGKLMLNALPVVLLSLEQGGLMTFSCKAAFFRKPWRVLSIPEVAFLEASILASLTAQTKASCTRAWAGELGHFLWRKLLNNIFLICSLYFSKVIAKTFWPMAILDSFQSALTLPPCQVKVYFSLTEHIDSLSLW